MVALKDARLLVQIGQMLLNGLDLELKFCQVGFQLLDLLGFGQKAALKTAISAATFTTTVTRLVLAITLFVHISPFDGSTIRF